MTAWPANGSNVDTWDAVLKTWLDEHMYPTLNAPVTLGAAATELAVTSQVVLLTGDGGGNTLATITGGIAGVPIILIFQDNKVTITDDATKTANTVNLSAAFTSAANSTMTLVFDGTSWYEVSRSTNG